MSFQSEISDIAEANGVKCVTLSGRLSGAASGDFEKSLQSLFDNQYNRVIMDFAEIDYIASAGLRIVLIAAKRVKQSRGRLVLCGLRPQIREVFEISGFLKILEVVDDCAQAVVKFL